MEARPSRALIWRAMLSASAWASGGGAAVAEASDDVEEGGTLRIPGADGDGFEDVGLGGTLASSGKRRRKFAGRTPMTVALLRPKRTEFADDGGVGAEAADPDSVGRG